MSLEVSKLEVGYVHKPLITNLTFRVQPPAFVAIVGHNGCGKSTFFKCLTGKHSYSGEIFISGKNLRSISNLPGKGYITLLEQKNNLNFNIPVKDLVLMGRFRFTGLFRNYSSEDEKAVNDVLELMEIGHLKEEDYLNLSGGEQQLVWLAQVMVQDSDVILLDEPTQQLDVYNRKRVFDLMQLWAYEKKKLLLCITHDIASLENLKGYLLNLSSKQAELFPLSPEVVLANQKMLEEKNPKKQGF